mmetsp:Transcript_10020/g.30613  ORF Transcript_10020/g.30613 Transcript_10020/m.30613 type:complete len:409 (+) Transcript_10020:220-1446(+)
MNGRLLLSGRWSVASRIIERRLRTKRAGKALSSTLSVSKVRILAAALVLFTCRHVLYNAGKVAVLGPEIYPRSQLEFNEAHLNTSLRHPDGYEHLLAEKISVDGKRCKIPKVLHQTYKTDNQDEWPVKEWTRYRESWLNNHPASDGWTQQLWTDDENRALVETFYPEYLEQYDSITLGVSRADFVRMLYMHLFGGVYADMDVASFAPLEVFFEENEDACENSGVITGHMGVDDGTDSVPNAFLMSEAGHPLWRFCIETAPTYAIAVEARYGPIHLKRCIKAFTQNAMNEQTRKQGGELNKAGDKYGSIFLAPGAYFYPFSWADSVSMPACWDYRQALGENEYADPEIRGRCEDELKEYADRSLLNANRRAPITYTVWCHSWGQFMERNKLTYRISRMLKYIHPKLSDF